MKGLRHAKIKEIIERYAVETQEDMAEALRKEGIEVTQATVSRDIKELMLIKVPTGDGHYRYAFPPEQNMLLSQSRMERIFQDSVISMDYSQNIIVLRTQQGAAPSVAYTIDYIKWPEVIGTVAGEDTILVVVKPMEATPRIMAKFRALLS
jgi:transcriptional regulator of arginine metabolism